MRDVKKVKQTLLKTVSSVDRERDKVVESVHESSSGVWMPL